VLVEGVWGSVGISAEVVSGLVEPLGASVLVERLSEDSLLWGKDVDDERYAVVVSGD
jgi:hypothetical protein